MLSHMNKIQRPLPAQAWKSWLLAAAGVACSWSALAAPVETKGFLKFEFYDAINGTPVQNLLDDAKYPASPDLVSYVGGADTRNVFYNDSHENYGGRMSGYFTPLETGSYRFFISSDDASTLQISTDDKPANLVDAAAETGCCNAFTEPDSARTSEPIPMVAGKKYYLELIWKEGGGGDYAKMAFRKEGDTASAGSLQPIAPAYLSSLAEANGGTAAITQNPANANVAENSSVTFTVAGNATTTYLRYPDESTIAPVIQWYKNGTPIAGANGTNLTIALAKASDNGAKFKASIAVPGVTATSTEATLTVTSDTTAPTVADIRGSDLFTAINVKFSEPVGATAEDKANYSVDKGITISSVTRVDANSVRLITSKQLENTLYTVTVNGVKDTATPANTIAAATKKTFTSFAFVTGGILHRFFQDNGGNNIAALTNFANYIADKPTFTTVEPLMEYGANGSNESGSNYGNDLQGYLLPPKTGDYVFYCSGDDPVRVYLSTDDSPANVKLIASEPQWNNARQWLVTDRRNADAPENRSDTYADTEWPTGNKITLTTGKRYYIHVLHTEGGGGDSMGVAWKLPGVTDDPANGSAPISAQYVGLYLDPTGASVVFTQQPASVTTAANNAVTFTAKVDAISPYGTNILYIWRKNGVAIDGAPNLPTYTIPVVALSDNGSKYSVEDKLTPASAISSEATLTVNTDNQPPTVTAIDGSDSFTALTVHFSEPVTAASAGTAANYAVDGGVTVSAATVVDDFTVKLTTSKEAIGTDYNLTVNNVADNAGNKIAANTKVKFTTWALVAGRVKIERFNGISGTPVQNLLDDPKWAANTPDVVGYLGGFTFGEPAFGDTYGDNYGARLTAFITPTETASYNFFVRSDDASQLFVSSSETFPVPGTDAVVAEETGCCNAFQESDGTHTQTSAGVALVANKRYAVTYLVKEGGGGDWGQVAWRKVGDTKPVASALSPITTAASWYGPKVVTPPNASLSAGRNGAGALVITYTGGVLNSATSVNGPFTPVAGATSPYTPATTGTAQFFLLK